MKYTQDDLNTLYQITSTVNQYTEAEKILQSSVGELLDLFKVDGVEIYCISPDNRYLTLVAHSGLSRSETGSNILQIGQGPAGTVYKKSKPCRFSLKQTIDDEINTALEHANAFCYLGIPLTAGKKVWGVLGLYTKSDKIFTDEFEALICLAGNEIARALHRAQNFEQAANRAKRFLTITQTITATRQLDKPEHVLQNLSKVLVQSLGFDQSWIALVHNSHTLIGQAGFGTKMHKSNVSVSFDLEPDSANPAIQAIIDRKPVICQFVEDIKAGPFKQWLTRLNSKACLIIPIQNQDIILGVIGVFFVTDHDFADEDIRTLNSVAEQASIAIQNAQLYEQIKHSEDRYRTLFEAAGTSIVILDKDLQFQLVNHAFEKLSGLNRKSLVGKKKLTEFLNPESPYLFSKGKDKDCSHEIIFIDSKRKTKHVHITTRLIPDTKNTLVSLIDMTRQRELERRLYRSEELASIGELSAGIAHEIRNPLAAISNSVSLLMDEPQMTDEGKQLLDVVKEESDHLAAIVDDFLKFARPKKPQFEQEDINRLIKDTVKRCQDLTSKQIQWNEMYGDEIMIDLDRHQIQQVLTNLLMNGMDAMDDGGTIDIRTELLNDSQEKQIKISITDAGIGIPEDEIPRIFQPFFSTKEKGTGMGLAICRRIIDNHSGEVYVTSTPGEGTTFSLVFPVQNAHKTDKQ